MQQCFDLVEMPFAASPGPFHPFPPLPFGDRDELSHPKELSASRAERRIRVPKEVSMFFHCFDFCYRLIMEQFS